MILRVLLACASLWGAGTAAAQDLAPAGAWSGPYGGVSIGAAGSDGRARRGDFAGAVITRDVESGLFPASIDRQQSAALAGGMLGYNLAFGEYLAGIEIDAAFTDLDARARFSRIDPTPPPDPFAGVLTRSTYGTRIDALGSLRLRLGLAQGSTLFYATGGLAAGRVTNSWGLDLPNFAIPYSNRWRERDTRFGYAIGVGVEQRVAAGTSIRAEFLHVDLEDVRVRAEDPPFFGDNRITYRFRNTVQMLRAGLAIRF